MEVLTARANHYHNQQHHHLHGRANMSAGAPPQSQLVLSQAHTSSNYSIQTQASQISSRSSGGTDTTSHSTLFPPPPLPANGRKVGMAGPNSDMVMPTDHIMNTMADGSSSLFQICVGLRQRLAGVSELNEVLEEEEEEADEDTDPVTLLWRTFRKGTPLMELYNALRPATPLNLPDTVKEEKKAKAATFKFLQACIKDLQIPSDELFIVTDLYGDDTTGFVKVARVVNRVLDILVHRGLAQDVRPTESDLEQAEMGMKRTQRQHIVAELVKTERTYVQHLELLQAFKHMVEEKGIIPGDAVHDIFLNLNTLLDFQRRFLIRVEQENARHEEEQNWGRQFMLYNDAFRVYEPYIANQKKCEKTVLAEFAKLKEAGGSIEMRQMVETPASLCSFLMKPFQRLTKYPLLLSELNKRGDLDDERKQDLLTGIEATTAVLNRINLAVDKEEKVEAVQDLKVRVEDWKGHRVEAFGELLLYGTFTVLKSENLAAGKDAERSYHVYLFETILLCCKNIDVTKPKYKPTNKTAIDNRGKPKLQLKGRIFMQNVTDLVSLAKPGSYTCQIFWKGDPGIENFIIRFTTEEMLKKWSAQIEAQRRKFRDRYSTSRSSDGSRPGTSVTEFSYLQNQPALENPYKEFDEDEDDDDDGSTMTGSADTVIGSGGYWSGHPSASTFTQSRNGSSSSLRSRSTTSESTHSQQSVRQAAPRLPQGSLQHPALSLRTRELQQGAGSPNAERMESYFSPVAETPMSSRTSASSAMYPFPRQAMPQNAYYEEGHGQSRFTAPAMPRPPLNTNASNGYAPGRTPSGRPGFPPGAGMHSSVQMPGPRNRSASSPDINQRMPLRSGSQPPVPEMPASFQNPSRSQNNSPSLQNGLPGRDSPQMLRERQYSVQHDASPIEHGYVGQQRPSGGSYAGSRTLTPVSSISQTMSPPPQPESSTTPAQLKVKVHCPSASQTLTLVVSTTISYQTLKDRIDAKLQRSTNLTLQDRGPRDTMERFHVKLKYLDDDDYVSIQSDEDVQTAFETWREQKGEGIGGMGEIELFCQR